MQDRSQKNPHDRDHLPKTYDEYSAMCEIVGAKQLLSEASFAQANQFFEESDRAVLERQPIAIPSEVNDEESYLLAGLGQWLHLDDIASQYATLKLPKASD